MQYIGFHLFWNSNSSSSESENSERSNSTIQEKEEEDDLLKYQSQLKNINITSDASSSNKKAFKLSDYVSSHMICFCHTINNVILNSYKNCKPFKQSIKKANNLSKKVRKLPLLKRSFLQIYEQKAQNQKFLQLQKLQDTRWNCIIRLIRPLIRSKKQIKQLKENNLVLKKYELNDHEFLDLKDILQFLLFFEETIMVAEQKYAITSSYVLPFIETAKEEFNFEPQGSKLIKDIKTQMKLEFEKRIKLHSKDKIITNLSITSILNPNTLILFFENQKLYNQGMSELNQQFILTYKQLSSKIEQDQQQIQQNLPVFKPSTGVFGKMRSLKKVQTSNNILTPKFTHLDVQLKFEQEIQQYLMIVKDLDQYVSTNSPILKYDEKGNINEIEFWKFQIKSNSLPILTKLQYDKKNAQR